MTTMISSGSDGAPVATIADPAQRLRTTMCGVKVTISWLGVRKALSPQQKSQAADVFGASDAFVSAFKRILDISHPAYRAVTAIRSRVVAYWRSVTLPYPEPGTRLLPQHRVAAFDAQMNEFRQALSQAVDELQERYRELRQLARRRLGELYNENDYPDSLQGLFDLEWSYPAVEPPDYLRQLNPEIYRQECARVAGRFDEAVRLAEDAFTSELARLVDHLVDRLSGSDDGRPKVFRDSAVNNLLDFFERFRALNVGSNQQLEDLVDQCRQAIEGRSPQSLRDGGALRNYVATQLAVVQSRLDGLIVDRPRRNILRAPR